MGNLCNECAASRIGPSCEKLPFTTEIVPDTGSDLGGILVNIRGYNFNISTNYTCRFDLLEVAGTTVSSNLVQCRSPQHAAGYVTVSLKNIQSSATARFLYVANCGSNDCGIRITPRQGYCTFGRCVCEKLWQGNICEIPVIKPNFVYGHPGVIREFDEFAIKINITEGTQPIVWSSAIPKGARFNQTAGIIKMKARDDEFLAFQVTASNSAGATSKALNLTVKPAYRIKNLTNDITPVLPAPTIVTINGEIEIINGQEVPNVPVVPIVLRVLSLHNGEVRTLRPTVRIVFNEMNFSTVYVPSQEDVGKYIVDAVHPFYVNKPVEEMVSWNVLGLTTSPKTISLNGFIDELDEPQYICSVVNPGAETLTNIRYELITQMPSGVSISLSSTESSPQGALVTSLASGTSFNLYMSVLSKIPLKGRVVFALTTSEGSKNFFAVNLATEARKSFLRLNPPHIDVAVVRGSLTVVPIQISNVGSLFASNITADLPQGAGISIMAIGRKDLKIGESATITIKFSYPEDEPLGARYGSVIVRSSDNWLELRYHIIITSDSKQSIKILVEDEYTYFKDDKPKLAGATVELSGVDTATSFSGRKQTGSDGLATFPDVNEAFYNLYVHAEDHESWRGVVHFSPAAPNKTVFLQREKVKVKFVVTYSPITDEYIIDLESTFETAVPLPVVNFNPLRMDLRDFEEGKKDRIDIAVTNHGLIAVNNVKIASVDCHPFLDFLPLNEIPLLPGNTTYSLSLTVNKTQGNNCTTPSERCAIRIKISYTYNSSKVQQGEGLVVLSKPCPELPDIEPEPNGIGFSKGILRDVTFFDPPPATNRTYNYEIKTKIDCRDTAWTVTQNGSQEHPDTGNRTQNGHQCARSGSGCLVSLVKSIPGLCFIHEAAYIGLGHLRGDVDWRNEAKTFGLCLVGTFAPLADLLKTALSVGSCGIGLKENDRAQFFFGATGITLEDLTDNYKFLLKMMEIEFKRLNQTWAKQIFERIADHSDLGNFISDTEWADLTKVAQSLPQQEMYLMQFLNRWNHSMEFWQLGKNTSNNYTKIWDPSEATLLRLSMKAAVTEAKSLGYSSVADWSVNQYDHFIKYVEEYEQSQVVCAEVRVKISQRAVLTRDAFKATLEIENGQSNSLENILVKLRIWHTGDILRISQLEHFTIGSPILSGISSVAGSSNLSAATSASADWLIIPRQTAAPEAEEEFYVGGVIEYIIDGVKSNTVLAPGRITVKAQPELHLHYFHEKYIYGDDPFTDGTIEESIPFVLAVVIVNKGNGEARDLRITSAQPEIIENEKGLLIDFEINGCQLGLNEIEKSLTVNFGTIPPRSVKVAQWLLTSSLNGQFFNLSASFVNINPLGDETLSLIKSVSYHELIHVIEKLSEDNENFYGDFLVNDNLDALSYPETIYETVNGSVQRAIVGQLRNSSAIVSDLKVEVKFDMPNNQNGSQWFYGRASIDKESAPPRGYVPVAFVDETGSKKPIRNVWITYSVMKENPWINIADLITESQRPTCCTYLVEFEQPHTEATKSVHSTTSSAGLGITTTLEPRGNITTSGSGETKATSEPLSSTTPAVSASNTSCGNFTNYFEHAYAVFESHGADPCGGRTACSTGCEGCTMQPGDVAVYSVDSCSGYVAITTSSQCVLRRASRGEIKLACGERGIVAFNFQKDDYFTSISAEDISGVISAACAEYRAGEMQCPT